MFRQIINVIAGSIYWNVLRLTEHINYTKVVLVLTGENPEVDEYALKYLDDVMDRKYTQKALIITEDCETAERVRNYRGIKHPTKVKILRTRIIELLYKRYCFDKYFENLFFTYIDMTKDNLLGRFMRETDIDARDVVCLALYNLRTVPDKR